jgi:hypothetical protein
MALKDYYSALERLKNNKPEILHRNAFSINNDTVALEAGRKRGSIKVSRYPELIEAIQKSEKLRCNSSFSATERHKAKAEKEKNAHHDLELKYQSSLNREVMLVEQLRKLEKEIIKLKSSVIEFPI